MPNWCHNEMSVSGSPEDLQKFKDACIGDDDGQPTLDFEGSVPIPEELKDTVTGAMQIGDKIYAVWKMVDGEAVPVPEETLKRYREEYGALNWYDWCRDNWGTKWSAGQCGMEDFGTMLQISFDTAWAPPEAWVRNTAKVFPTLTFGVDYQVEGENFFSVGPESPSMS